MMLCVVMSYSGFAFATETGDAGTPAKKTSQEQVGNYYEANSATGTLAATPTVLEGSTQKSYEGGKVLVNKTIKGTDNENEFEITLDVTTKRDIIEEAAPEDSVTVLVIDRSGSMDTKENGVSRLSSVQQAAKTFIDSYKSNDAERKIAIVTFSGIDTADWPKLEATNGATAELGWTDASDAKVKTKIDGITANGGTNLQAGLQLAKNLLSQDIKNSKGESITNKNIILLSDGEPTYALTSDADTTSTTVICKDGKGMIGNGISSSAKDTSEEKRTDSKHEIHTQTETVANSFPANVSKYAVYVGNETVRCPKSGCPLHHNNASNDKHGSDWLREDCGFTTRQVSDLSELTKIFTNISRRIQIKAEAWVLTDPMGEFIDFTKVLTDADKDQGLSFDAATNTLTWDLKQADLPTPVKDSNNNESYTYSFKYKVKLDNLDSGYTAGTFVPANGETSLTYCIYDDTKKQTNPDYKGDEGTAYFNVPSVKGLEGSLSFIKVDECGEHPLTGAQFTLTAKDDSSFKLTASSVAEVKTTTTDETTGESEEEVTIPAGTVAFTNVPSGHEYVLTESNAPANYVAATGLGDVTVSFGDATNPVTTGKVINQADTTEITVSKNWSDADNQDGKRPGKINVQLYADGEAYGTPVELNASNSWSYTFTGLKKAAHGTAITYTVDEVDVPAGYTKSISGFTITNSHTPETVSVEGSKTWVGDWVDEETTEEESDITALEETDGEDAGETPAEETKEPSPRPESIKVNLKKNETIIDTKTVTAEDDWSWSWTGLAKYENGTEIVYTVTEDTVTNYTTSISGYNITNTYAPNKTSVTVNKAWDDANDQDGKRPESVVIALYADGKETGKTVTLSKENNWQAVFEDLKARTEESNADSAIAYTVKEVTEGMPEGYTAEVTGLQTSGYTVTNSYTPETTTLGVKKVWNDNDNSAKARPESVKIYLVADGEVTDTYVTLNADNNWQATFTGIAKKSKGKDIEYSVKEAEAKEYTTESVVKNNDGIWEVTNKYTPTYIPPITPSGDDDPEEPPVNPDDPSDDPDNPPVDPNGGSDVIGGDDPINGDPMGDPDVIGSDDPEDIGADPMGVKTGDEAGMIPWALCFGTAIMMLGGAVALRRKEEE